MICAPVALFVYNCPEYLCQTVEALLANAEASETPLYIFSDATRNESASQAVDEVKSYICSITGFKVVSLLSAPVSLAIRCDGNAVS